MQRKKDLTNLVALSCIQVSNGILPLFVFPYALSVVGFDLYSMIVVTEAVILMVLSAVLYSFDVEGVSKVVGLDIKKDIEELSRIFSEILYVRIAIWGLCVVALLLAGFFLRREYLFLFLWWMLLPLSYVVQSSWLFQGLEKNVAIAAFVVLSRLLCVAFILFLVKSPSDYYMVPAVIGSCFIFGGLLSLAYAFSKLGLRFKFVVLSDLLQLVRNGKEIFLGNFSVLLYRDVNVILLQLVGGSQQAVAVYSVAEKLVKSTQASVRPLNQLFFPKALRALKDSKGADWGAFKKILRLTTPQLLALSGLIASVGVVYAALGNRIPFVRDFPDRDQIAPLVMMMMVTVFFGVSNFMFGTVGLNRLGERTYYFQSILAVGLLNLAICALLSSQLGSVGASLSFAISEILLLTLVVRRYSLRTSS